MTWIIVGIVIFLLLVFTSGEIGALDYFVLSIIKILGYLLLVGVFIYLLYILLFTWWYAQYKFDAYWISFSSPYLFLCLRYSSKLDSSDTSLGERPSHSFWSRNLQHTYSQNMKKWLFIQITPINHHFTNYNLHICKFFCTFAAKIKQLWRTKIK